MKARPKLGCCFVTWTNSRIRNRLDSESVSQHEREADWSGLLSDIDAQIPPAEGVPEARSNEKSDLLTFLGSAYMLKVLHEFVLDPGPWRFNELRERLDVPPTTLTNRLKELTDAGLVVRESYDEIPPRVEYTATEKLLDFRPVFGCLGIWVEKHGWEEVRSEAPEES